MSQALTIKKTLTTEHKLKISQTLKGKYVGGNSFRHGLKSTAETRAKIGASSKLRVGGKNSRWLGDKVGYRALHTWVYSQLGAPRQCENCESTDRNVYQWANISGEYKRDVSDWARLCVSCHMIIDNVKEKAKITRESRK